jgi:CrcB protein
MDAIIYLFVGSGLGGVCRYGVSLLINEFISSKFPWGTLVVNILACLLVGFLSGLVTTKVMTNPAFRLFLIVGFCGGFSTFSTFSAELLSLFQNHSGLAVLYIVSSIAGCLMATYSGIYLSGRLL